MDGFGPCRARHSAHTHVLIELPVISSTCSHPLTTPCLISPSSIYRNWASYGLFQVFGFFLSFFFIDLYAQSCIRSLYTTTLHQLLTLGTALCHQSPSHSTNSSRASLPQSSFSCLKSIGSSAQSHTAEKMGTHHHPESYFAVARAGRGAQSDEQVLCKQL